MGVHTGVAELLRKRQLAANTGSPEQDPFTVNVVPGSTVERVGSSTVIREVSFSSGPITESQSVPLTAAESRGRSVEFFRRLSKTVFGQQIESA